MTQTEYEMIVIIVGVFVTILTVLIGVMVVKRFKKSDSGASKFIQPSNEAIKPVFQGSVSKGSLIQDSLMATRGVFWDKISKALLSTGDDAQVFDQLEEALYLSDLGPKVVEHFLSQIKCLDSAQRKDLELIKNHLKIESARILDQVQASENLKKLNIKNKPAVFLIIGVNGAGKTTSIGKIAHLACQKGLKVLVAAGDTFRAAAQEQLSVWAARAQVGVFAPEGVKDPGAIAFEAIRKGEKEGYDLILVDTAGRLHTSHNLMEELKKVYRVMQKAMPSAPHEVLLVLDACGGQNAVIQAEEFSNVVPVTGLILTKLDGTSKGGMVLSAVDSVKVPIVWIGVGEQAQDLVAFNGQEFAESLLSDL